MLIYYFAIKVMFLFGLVRSLVAFDVLQRHVLFLGLLYTGGVAFLSWVFLLSYQPVVDWSDWKWWLGRTLLLVLVYFALLVKFDESKLFWIILPLGIFVAFY